MNSEIPKEKQTTLGLYLTAKEAYEKWQSDPENVMIIDVRTPEEYIYVGHPTMAWKIPIFTQNYDWNTDSSKYPMELLPDFVERIQTVAKDTNIIMTLCRSGGRSAIAANLLAQAGFKQVYNIIDGMEGDNHNDPELMHQGGWKNSGCPWTKKLTPEKSVLPSIPQK